MKLESFPWIVLVIAWALVIGAMLTGCSGFSAKEVYPEIPTLSDMMEPLR